MKQYVINSIDLYIRDNVVKLNKMGMRTLFCCSGLDEDHDYAKEDPSIAAYLCVDLDSISKKTLRAVTISVAANALYTDDGYDFQMWIIELSGLIGDDQEISVPCFSFRLFPLNYEFEREEVQLHIKQRWDKLFELLFDVLDV